MNALQWLQFMLSYVLQAALVIGFAWGIERWTSAAEAKTRVWSGCFVSLLGLLVVGLLLPRLQWFHPWSRLGHEELLRVATAEFVLGRSLLAIWLGGVVVMLLRWLFQFVELQRFIRTCPRLSPPQVAALQSLLDAELLWPGGRQVEFRRSPQELGPFCYQFHEPVICLPQMLLDGNRTELAHVLHHELTHLTTRHPMQLFSQKVVATVLWFHPLVWISAKRASLVREFVCDEAAAQQGAATASYLRVLLRIVEQQHPPRTGTLAMGRATSELKLRAQRLVGLRGTATSRLGRIGQVAVVIAAALVSQLWLPTDPLVSAESDYSPWPTWTAATLHSFDLPVRDFGPYDTRIQLHELVTHHRVSGAEKLP